MLSLYYPKGVKQSLRTPNDSQVFFRLWVLRS